MLTENFNLESMNQDNGNLKKAPFSIKKSYYEEDNETKALHGTGSDSLSHDEVQPLAETSLSSPQVDHEESLSTDDFDDLTCDKKEIPSAGQDANIVAPTNYSYDDYLHGQPVVPFELCPMAGLRFTDAQAINAAIVRGKVAAAALHEMNKEKFSYMTAVESYKHQLADTSIRSLDAPGQTVPITTQKDLPNYRKIERKFIENFAVVKVRPRYSAKWEFMKRSSYYHIHEQVSEQDLLQEYLTFLDDILPANDVSSQAVKEQSFKRMKCTIPRLENSGLYILKEYEVMFSDGIYNVKTGKFQPINQNEHIFLF